MKEIKYQSRSVTSNQSGIHENLELIVSKHLKSKYRKPIQDHNREAFATIQKAIAESPAKSVILDSCCGTGASSIYFAQKNPNSLVVGVDQSYKRLNKKDEERFIPQNCLLLRANCEDIWRLCVDNKIEFSQHFILYPNPWPKSEHLKRRWHGHPVFSYLPKLSPYTELRSNWPVYLEEFSLSWQLATNIDSQLNEMAIVEPITLFEKKYSQSGQKLYQLVLQ